MIITRGQTSFYILKNFSLFKDLDDGIKKDLASQSILLTLQTRKNIGNEFEIADKVYLLAEGKVFLSYIDSEGRKIILENLEEGSVFGDLDFLGEDQYHQESFFIEPYPKTTAKICEFNKNAFLKILSSHPSLSLPVLSSVSKRVSRLEKKIEELAFYSLKGRLLSELIRLSYPVDKRENVFKVRFKLTHEKLAQTIGAVRETVSKALTELKKEGFVFYDNRKHLIVNLVSRRGKSPSR